MWWMASPSRVTIPLGYGRGLVAALKSNRWTAGGGCQSRMWLGAGDHGSGRCPGAVTRAARRAAMGFLPGDGDEYIITGGGLAGQRGFFSRDDRGAVIGVDLAGRLFSRTTNAG
jgi:hypothetical protein